MQGDDNSFSSSSVAEMSYLIHHFLERSADTSPDKEALVHGKERFTYLEIEQRSNRVAAFFSDRGLIKGERVALLLRNSVDYVCSYYGVLKAGGVVVPLNTGMEARDLSGITASCEAGWLVYEKFFHGLVSDQLLPACPGIEHVISAGGATAKPVLFRGGFITLCEIFETYPCDRSEKMIIDKDVSSIIYTSGSTGVPKGVTLSHLNIVSNTRSINSYLSLSGTDRCIVILPFYYVYGKTLLNLHFMVSGTVVIDNRFTFPNVVLKTMIEERVTGLSGVPSTFFILLDKSSIAKMEFPDLRYLTQAGGHMSRDTKNALMRIFPNKRIFIMYGATEASARLSWLPPEDLVKKIDSIGKPIPNVEMKVVLEDGRTAAVGEEGEIVARGSNIMEGYWDAPEETSRALASGWYYTGDIGRVDEDGCFFVTGRKKEMIKTGVHKISGREIEDVLLRHPDVSEAAVIGVPDELLGEAVKAFVVISEGSRAEAEELKEYCGQSLPPYKVPKEVGFVDFLPKNESGKILKQKLR